MQNLDNVFKKFINVYNAKYYNYSPQDNTLHCSLARYLCQQSEGQMQEFIQKATAVQFDAMLSCLVWVNAVKNMHETEEGAYKIVDSAPDIDGNKIKFYLQKCYDVLSGLLVINDRSETEDLMLKQALLENNLIEALQKLNIKHELPEVLSDEVPAKTKPSINSSALNAVNSHLNVCGESSLELYKSKLINSSEMSFVGFLIMINDRLELKNIIKYIDFLKPEYFEWQRLIGFMNFVVEFCDELKCATLGLDCIEMTEKIINFVNKITFVKILSMLRNAGANYFGCIKGFVGNVLTREQLFVFWLKASEKNLKDVSSSLMQYVEYAQTMFVDCMIDSANDAAGHEIFNDILNLRSVESVFIKDLLMKLPFVSLCRMHCFAFSSEGKKMLDVDKKIKEYFYDIIKGYLDCSDTFSLAHSMQKYDYYAIVQHFSYNKICELVDIFNNSQQSLKSSKLKVYDNIQEWLSNGFWCDKKQDIVELIEKEKIQHHDVEMQCSAKSYDEEKGAAVVDCDDQNNLQDSCSALSFLSNVEVDVVDNAKKKLATFYVC